MHIKEEFFVALQIWGTILVHLVMLMIGDDLECSGIISTEGVLRRPMTYEDHPNPI